MFRCAVPALVGLALGFAVNSSIYAASLDDIPAVFDLASQKYTAYYNSLSATSLNNLGSTSSPPSIFPTYTSTAGWSAKGGAGDWRSGFYAGILWEIYAHDGQDPTTRTMAQNFTFGVRNNISTGNHDVGFRTLSSYVRAAEALGGDTIYTYRGTADLSYNTQIQNAAIHLASRFVPAVGATRSWGNPGDADTQVIADNMMNLEILFKGAQLGAASPIDGYSLTDIAITHARTTFRDFVRADGSSVHVVDYNTSTGAMNFRQSSQGITSFGKDMPAITGETYETVGTWSRGQAWLISGFTMMYGNTHSAEFLSDAQTVANYWVKRTSENVGAGASYIPPTDFDVALVGVADDAMHQDTSAAAIAADALLQLAAYTDDPALKAQYWGTAVNTLEDLLSPAYFSDTPARGALLMHGANAFSVGGEDNSLIYGDYYLLDALTRYESLAPTINIPEPASALSLLVSGALAIFLRRGRRMAMR